jgi:hypothetical protein
MSISQEQAIKTLQKLVEEIDLLKKKNRAFSEAHSRWLVNALAATEELFGQRSRIYLSIANLTWRRQGEFVVETRVDRMTDLNKIAERIDHEAYLKQLDTAKGFLMAGIDQINLYGIEEVYKSKDSAKESSEIIKILDLAENKLRKIVRDVPQREKDIQDKFEELLVAMDIDYLREQEKIVYSSKTYHPDFCFPQIGTILEIKLCDKKEREREIISEINDDIIAYKTKYSNIIFLVYDTGHIRDKDRFKEDIEAEGTVLVSVVKH